MKLRKIIALFSILILLVACEEMVDRPIFNENSDALVVEGLLSNEKTNHRITLSRGYSSQNENPMPISGAIVRVIEGTTVYAVTESPVGSGNYFTEEMRAVFGKTYTLSIQYQGREYSAMDSSLPVEPLQALQYEKLNEEYRLVQSNAGENANFIAHQVSWSSTPSCTTGNNCEGIVVFYDLKTLDVNEIYKPGKADFSFPVNSIVIRKKYSASAAYRTFLRSVLSETEWRGGVFDVQRANATTNLSEGAIGFFAVSTVVSDTTLIVAKP